MRTLFAGTPNSTWLSTSPRTRRPQICFVLDLCITDYSSVMFDFTVTGKPLLFFTPDYERYMNEQRGVYFELRSGTRPHAEHDGRGGGGRRQRNDQAAMVRALRRVDPTVQRLG